MSDLPFFAGTILVSALCLAGSARPIFANPVPSLTSEVVTLRVADHSLEVTGRYVFDGNGAGTNLNVLYPISENWGLGAPRVLWAGIRCSGSKERDLPVRKTDLGWAWELPFRDTNHCEVTIRYRQELGGTRAEYTLRTARGWPEPMRSARLLVFLPHGVSMKQASYPFRVLWRDRSGTMYVHEETDFVPENDLIVEWAPA